MHLMSSRATFLTKRVLPTIWFGGAAAFLVGVLHDKAPLPFVFFPLVMAIVGYLMMSRLYFPLVDEAWDAEGELVFRKGGHEARVPLSEIVNIDHRTFTNPERVSLSLRHPTALGQEISFMPPLRLFVFARSPMVDDLVRRVDAARQRR